MKTTMNLFTKQLILLALIISSCDKPEINSDIPKNDSQTEGFISETGNNDSKIDATSEFLYPLLHRRYDAFLSKEEASNLFSSEISKYMKDDGKENRSTSYFYFEVWTRTSDYSHSQTDGNVWGRFNFLTDQGPKNLPWARMKNEGDNRQNGSWDFYYFGTHTSPINWLEAKSATLALQGTDGWHIKYFDVRVWASKQFGSSTGNSRVLSSPEIWLDNATATGWDYYYTGNVGTGRTVFN